MKYHAFYVNGNLLIRIKNKTTTKVEQVDNLVALYNDDEIIGYNILDFKSDFVNDGLVDPNENLTNEINDILQKEQYPLLKTDFEEYIVVGYVKERENHPESKKLSITKVDLGDEEVQIVCGAPNVDAGQKVVVAKIGAVLKDGTWIMPGKLLKVESNGMICSKKELGLIQDEPGIYVLDDSYEIGVPFIAKN